MASKTVVLVRSSSLRIFVFMATALVTLAMTPFVIHSLGNSMYGLWILIGSFMGYYGLFDFGLGSVVQRFVSSAIGKKDYKEANICISTMFFMYSIIAIILIILSAIIVFVAPLIVHNNQFLRIFRQIIFILGFSIACSFPLRVFTGILISHTRYDLVAAVELLQLFVRTLLVIWSLKSGHGIIALALITLGVDWLGYVSYFLLSKKIMRSFRLSRLFIDIRRIRSFLNYSVYTFTSQIADKLLFKMDYFVIAGFVGLSAITVYSIASRLISYFMEFITSAIGIMLPVFSQYEAKGDYNSIREKYILVTKISSYLSIAVGAIMLTSGKAFITKWMGNEYLYAYNILVILLIPTILSFMQGPVFGLLLGISKHKFYSFTKLGEGILNLILSLILVRKYGVIGVALGTAIPMIITKLIIQPVYVCKVINLSIKYYYGGVLIPIVVESTFIIALAWLLFRALIIPEYFSLLMFSSCLVTFFAIVVFIFGFNKREKSYFLKLTKF